MAKYPEISDQHVRIMQMLHLSLGLAVVPLSIIIPTLAGSTAASEGDYNTIMMLTQFHAVVFIASIFGSGFVTAKVMKNSSERLHTVSLSERDAAWAAWLESHKNAHIIALSLREGPALLGLVTLLIASINGVLWENPFFWVNYFSTALFILFLFLSFPTKEKISAAAQF